MKFSGPLFIVGMPRSGTKLLRTLLNNHRQVFIPSIETNFIPLMDDLIQQYNIKNIENFHKFYATLSKTAYFQYRKLEGLENIKEEEWFRGCRTFTTEELFKMLIFFDIGLQSNNCENVIWGDKSPSYINHTSRIKEIYPQAKFLHLIRDVRDYCLSINKAWGKNMYRAAHRWNHDILNFRKSITPYSSDVLEIKYEDLISYPQKSLNEICHFLSVPFEEDMHILKMATENLGEAKNLAFIKDDNKNKFIRKLSSKDKEKIEGIALDCLKRSNYPMSASVKKVSLSKQKLSFYKVKDGINLIWFYVKDKSISLFSALRINKIA